jgi:hypothetical protein
MFIRMVFKEKNMLNLGPDLKLLMRAEQMAQSLAEAKHLYEAHWHRELWQDEQRLVVEVRAPMLGHHFYEIDGTENELRLVVEALEKHFVQQ